MSTKNLQTLAVHNGTTSQPLQVGQTYKFKAKAGERYRIVKRDGDAEQLLDNFLVKRRGEDLLLSYHEGTEVTLENYYGEAGVGLVQ
jgi:hypothetical protein